MAAHTKIVELFGIPACGKSTLADYIVQNSPKGLKVANTHLARKELKHSSLYKILLSISIRDFFATTKYCLYFINDKEISKSKLLRFFKLLICRRFFRKYSQYDVIIIDQGIIQSFVSWENGRYLHKSKDFQEVIQQFLKRSYDSIFFFCNLPIDIAIERIKKRGKTVGRLDKIRMEDSDKLPTVYYREKEHFYVLADLLAKWSYPITTLDMAQSSEITSQDLLKCIGLEA